jgi:uncharacterized membrane protein YphA (DoxX/SURF4 family)
MRQPPAAWQRSHLLLFRTFVLFVLLFIISFPFGYHVLPDPGRYTQGVFESLARFTGDHIFRIQRKYSAGLVSDSTGFYINLFNVVILSLLLAVCWGLFFRSVRSHSRLLKVFIAFVRYYLALQLIIYGFSKIFKVQFYLPEPNILYTKLGAIPRDLLYWSTLGLSRPYSIFLGATELLAAILLLFRRTMLMGAFLASVILINITAINFAFDISVKLLSCFLLALALFLTGAVWRMQDAGYGIRDLKGRRIHRAGKTFVVALLFLEGLWVYISAGNFNDDRTARPYFHGAYQVKTFILNNDTLPPLLTDRVRWKRVFFHRKGYFIIEQMNEEMLDYSLNLDTTKRELYISASDDPQLFIFTYQVPDPSRIILEEINPAYQRKIILERLDWQNMPALRKEFNWTID